MATSLVLGGVKFGGFGVVVLFPLTPLRIFVGFAIGQEIKGVSFAVVEAATEYFPRISSSPNSYLSIVEGIDEVDRCIALAFVSKPNQACFLRPWRWRIEE